MATVVKILGTQHMKVREHAGEVFGATCEIEHYERTIGRFPQADAETIEHWREQLERATARCEQHREALEQASAQYFATIDELESNGRLSADYAAQWRAAHELAISGPSREEAAFREALRSGRVEFVIAE